MPAKSNFFLDNDPLWYKDAIIYQLHVKAYCDSNGDGVGDFKGLTSKLDYLKSLGITAIWLLPFYPSPMKDDGYDIAEYFDINPQYGTLKDFKEFLKQAHLRGLRVITELVINHTSDKHPWFLRAKRAKPGSRERNFYVWSETSDKYKEARIIFKDFEGSNWTWDAQAQSYYWHRFYSHQPDLNFDSPDVQKEIFKVADFWFDMGVDGMRLDAVPYLFEREGTNCENLPETYAFLKKFRGHIDKKYKGKMLLAEANQWPEDAAGYFGKGDECQMAFHFPLMPRMYMGLQMEDRYPIIDILEQTPAIPDNCQWAIFLRNHDELTLEMVTDEERDYMYRVYAKDPRSKINLGIRRRLVPLLNNDRKKIELMNILLMSLTGTPIIYYGDEIGMGDNYYLGDRDGVRTPMQWGPDRNAGFSNVNPHQLYLPVIIDPEFHYETVNVENQERNLSSMLWWMRRVLAMRKQFKAFSRGTLEFLNSDNPKVLSFIRKYGDEIILVIINLSRFSQAVEFDLSDYNGLIPEEVFSQNTFPMIKDEPYGVTLGPHNHFWLLLRTAKKTTIEKQEDVPLVTVSSAFEDIFDVKSRELEEDILPLYLNRCRWFAAKSQTIQSVKIVEKIPILGPDVLSYLCIIEVKMAYSGAAQYLLPLSIALDEEKFNIQKNSPKSVITRLHHQDQEALLYDGCYNNDLRLQILKLISRKKKLKGLKGELVGIPGRQFRTLNSKIKHPDNSHVLKAEQSNTSIIYDNVFFLKLFRKLEEGMNPDTEIIRYLTEVRGFLQIPTFAGTIEYHRARCEPVVACQIQSCVDNEGDAWKYTLEQLNEFYENVTVSKNPVPDIKDINRSLLDIDPNNLWPAVSQHMGTHYVEMIKVLGRRTGEMHFELSNDAQDINFKPEPFSVLYQRSLYQSLQGLTRKAFMSLSKNIKKLPKDIQPQAKETLQAESRILGVFRGILGKKFNAHKIRAHGDYHLGQVLYTGKDFYIIDFEGEPAHAMSERRLKRSALRDIAGMIRSFHYAAYSALFLKSDIDPEKLPVLEQWADIWYAFVSSTFLYSYLGSIGHTEIIPDDKDQLEILLQVFLMEKAVYELGYELNNRPDWVKIPLKGIASILKSSNITSRKVRHAKESTIPTE